MLSKRRSFTADDIEYSRPAIRRLDGKADM